MWGACFAVKILIVEGSPLYQKYLSGIVPKMHLNGGIEVESVGTLEECKERFTDFDIVVLDLHLPDSEPQNTVAWVIEARRKTAIVVVTGTKDNDLVRVLKGRGVGVVIKNEANAQQIEVELLGAMELLEKRRQRTQIIDEFTSAMGAIE